MPRAPKRSRRLRAAAEEADITVDSLDPRTRSTAPIRAAAEVAEITVDAFHDIHLHFPGDVYQIAVWIAMFDQALSTPTCKPGTTLLGLTSKLASLMWRLGSPWTAEKIMARFREHGLQGNPVIRLPHEQAEAWSAQFSRLPLSAHELD